MAANSDHALIQQLAKNSISLQKNNVDLIHSVQDLVKKMEDNNRTMETYHKEILFSVKESVDKLTGKMDDMLNLFSEASKHISDVGDDERIKMLTTKLESLLEQNKTIARGLLLLEKYVRGKSEFPTQGFDQENSKSMF